MNLNKILCFMNPDEEITIQLNSNGDYHSGTVEDFTNSAYGEYGSIVKIYNDGDFINFVIEGDFE